MRMLTGSMNIFTCEPHNELLSNRADNGAYTIANPGRAYAVYFPNGGSVDIDLRNGGNANPQSGTARWLNIANSEWAQEMEILFSESVTLSAPTKAHWVVLIQ